MGFLDFSFQTDINAGLAQYQADPKGSFAGCADPGGVHPRPHSRQSKSALAGDPDRGDGARSEYPLYVHCYSGARSGRAVTALRRMGYSHVTNIGGIRDYRGKTEGN